MFSLLDDRDEIDFEKRVQDREPGAPVCPVVLCRGCSHCQTSVTACFRTWLGARLFCFCLNQPSCLPELTRSPDPGADRSTSRTHAASTGLSSEPSLPFQQWLLFFRSTSPLNTCALSRVSFRPGRGPRVLGMPPSLLCFLRSSNSSLP